MCDAHTIEITRYSDQVAHLRIELTHYSDQVALLRIQMVRYSFLKDLEATVIRQQMELEFHHISDKNHHSSKNQHCE